VKKFIIFTVKALIIVLVFYYIFHGVDFEKILYEIESYSIFGLLLTFIIVFLGDVLVAYRLYYLCNKECTYKTSMEASMLSLVANSFMPAKMGEVSKIFYIHRKANIRKRKILSIIIFERFSDVVSLSLLLLVSSYIYISSNIYYILALTMVLSGILFVSILKNNYLFAKKMIKMIKYRKFKAYVYLFMKEMFFHLSNIKIFKLSFISLFIWCIYVLTNIVFFKYAIFIDIGFMQIFAISMIAFAVTALPLTPGGIGTFQAVFILMLTPKGFSKENIIAATFILQFLYILPSIIYLLYMFYLDKGFQNVFTKKL